jgi:hypothetical protein
LPPAAPILNWPQSKERQHSPGPPIWALCMTTCRYPLFPKSSPRRRVSELLRHPPHPSTLRPQRWRSAHWEAVACTMGSTRSNPVHSLGGRAAANMRACRHAFQAKKPELAAIPCRKSGGTCFQKHVCCISVGAACVQVSAFDKQRTIHPLGLGACRLQLSGTSPPARKCR